MKFAKLITKSIRDKVMVDLFNNAMHAGNLISKIFNQTKKESTKNVRMCVVGLDNAGKTTILKALS